MPVATADKLTSKLLIIGQKGHGKSTFCSVVSKLTAAKSKSKLTILGDVEVLGMHRVRGKDGNDAMFYFSKLNIESDKRKLVLYDFPSLKDFQDYAEGSDEEIDGVILVAHAVDGAGEEAKSQLVMIKDKIKDPKSLSVFLNKADKAEDKESIDLTEMTTKSMLTKLGLDGEGTFFFRGSASAVMDSNDKKSSKPFAEFLKGVNKLPAH